MSDFFYPNDSREDVLRACSNLKSTCPSVSPLWVNVTDVWDKMTEMQQSFILSSGSYPLASSISLWDTSSTIDRFSLPPSSRFAFSRFADFDRATMQREERVLDNLQSLRPTPYESVRGDKGDQPLLNSLYQLSVSTHAHRLMALWLCLQMHRHPSFGPFASQCLRSAFQVSLNLFSPSRRLNAFGVHRMLTLAQPLRAANSFIASQQLVFPPDSQMWTMDSAYWLRPSLEQAAQASLLLACPATATSSARLWTRVYFDDSPALRAYHHLVGSKTPRRNVDDHQIISISWKEGDDVAVASSGTFMENVDMSIASDLLADTGSALHEMHSSKIVRAIVKRKLHPVVWIRSNRSVATASMADLFLWDSDLCFSRDGADWVGFPFTVVTRLISSKKDATSQISQFLSENTLFTRLDQFNEYVAAAHLTSHIEASLPHPTWHSLLGKHVSRDWKMSLSSSETFHSGVSMLRAAEDFSEDIPLVTPNDMEYDSSSTPVYRLKQDAKTYWANERTLLSWISLTTFLSVATLQLLTLGSRAGQIAGTALAPTSIAIALYALGRFHFRNLAIRKTATDDEENEGQGIGVVDWWGPWIVVPVMCILLLMITLVSEVLL